MGCLTRGCSWPSRADYPSVLRAPWHIPRMCGTLFCRRWPTFTLAYCTAAPWTRILGAPPSPMHTSMEPIGSVEICSQDPCSHALFFPQNLSSLRFQEWQNWLYTTSYFECDESCESFTWGPQGLMRVLSYFQYCLRWSLAFYFVKRYTSKSGFAQQRKATEKGVTVLLLRSKDLRPNNVTYIILQGLDMWMWNSIIARP